MDRTIPAPHLCERYHVFFCLCSCTSRECFRFGLIMLFCSFYFSSYFFIQCHVLSCVCSCRLTQQNGWSKGSSDCFHSSGHPLKMKRAASDQTSLCIRGQAVINEIVCNVCGHSLSLHVNIYVLCVFVCVWVCVCVYVFVCVCVCFSLSLFLSLCLCLSLFLSLCISLSVFVSLSLSLCLSLSVCLSLSLSLFLSACRRFTVQVTRFFNEYRDKQWLETCMWMKGCIIAILGLW